MPGINEEDYFLSDAKSGWTHWTLLSGDASFWDLGLISSKNKWPKVIGTVTSAQKKMKKKEWCAFSFFSFGWATGWKVRLDSDPGLEEMNAMNFTRL